MLDVEQLSLLGQRQLTVSLPRDYEPARPAHFEEGPTPRRLAHAPLSWERRGAWQ